MPLNADQLERLRTRFPTLTIHPTCTLIDTHLDDHITLHENVTVANSRIGAHAIIETGAKLTHAKIGQRVRIGQHATISPGITIGNNSIIPPHATITTDINPANYSPTPDPDNDLPLDRFLLEKLPLHAVYQKWQAANGDTTLRLNYPLEKNARVLDVGGYLGDFAHELLAQHDVRIDLFEPVPAFTDHIKTRFANDPRVTIHNVGLAATTRTEQIALASESSSIIRDLAAPTQTIRLVAAREFLDTITGDIALLKINIEGAEYELLNHLLDTNLITRIRHLQIQFHDFVENARPRRRQLRTRLASTHTEQWNYPFIWESWQRKEQQHAAAS